ncbi:hypothetical protein [Streptomyces sp. NPDC090135]|uniref:hypothetical protein n=1 Tax=Streptomyces sp. NPDC090135 TaxID=3365957 RepID=UPI0037F2E948
MSHEKNCGAGLVADSLTDLLLGRRAAEGRGTGRAERPPAVTRVNGSGVPGVTAAAHPGLEILAIGAWEGEPLGLEPLVGLPHLRTLTACPGTLADPLEIARLDGLKIMDLANEILALRNRPPITRAVVEADLGPVG